MGSTCSKTDEVHPISVSYSPRILSPNHREQIQLISQEFLVKSTATDISLLRPIKWKRGNLIGEGVFGKVFQVLDTETGELLAAKNCKLSSNVTLAMRQLTNIFQEITILKLLKHPNIIQYFQVEFDRTTNSVDILMEYIPSGSLQILLKKYERLSELIVRNYTRKLLEGLKYLHGNKIIHRDLKSANILITEDGGLKLSDFGSSCKFGEDEAEESMSFKGSPYWMAPEVVLRQGHSFPADIWSLGCLIIEMIIGCPPWSDFSLNSREVLKHIATPDALPTIPNTSASLNDFIMKCLNRDPSKRPTAQELLSHEFLTPIDLQKSYDSIRNSLKVSISKTEGSEFVLVHKNSL